MRFAKEIVLLVAVCLIVAISLRSRQVETQPVQPTKPSQKRSSIKQSSQPASRVDLEIKKGNIDAILQNPKNVTIAHYGVLADREVGEVIASYRSIQKLADRLGLLTALGFAENRLATEFLMQECAFGLHGEKLTGEDGEAFLLLLRSLGIAAQSDDTAFAFLRDRIRPEIWRGENPIGLHETVDANAIALAGNTLQFLMLSGKPEAIETLLDVAGSVKHEPDSHMAAHIKSAAFLFDVARHDKARANDLLISGGMWDARNRWKLTADGVAWEKWRQTGKVPNKQ